MLNELISDFDEILDRRDFRNVEKIKTIGSTFMAAAGINNDVRDENTHAYAHLNELMGFVLELQKSVDEFNQASQVNCCRWESQVLEPYSQHEFIIYYYRLEFPAPTCPLDYQCHCNKSNRFLGTDCCVSYALSTLLSPSYDYEESSNY